MENMEVIENVYTNKQFQSEVNDFEDEYHEPDKDYSTNDDIMNNLIERLRSQKRKYTNFQQWCEAKEVYIEYTKRLIAKYGGRKKFKLLANIGMIDDYVPYCPKLKRNRKNKTYVTTKDLPYIPEFKASEDFIDKKEIMNLSHALIFIFTQISPVFALSHESGNHEQEVQTMYNIT